MPRSAVSLLRLLPTSDPASADTPLLRAFETTRSDGAFEELVRRHGPMVLGACRRVLGNDVDAEDAFQTVFLVLARKANTVRGNLAGWLYAVAVRTARGVRIMRERRRKHETEASARCEPAVLPETDHDFAAVIDEELARLPEHHREAVVLCELRGMSRTQAATELGIPEGTLSSRLAAAKRKLAARLSARGLAPTALVTLLAPASVSAVLVESAVTAVRGTAGPVASAAASAVVKAMLFDQLKVVALAAGILLTVVCGGWAMSGTPDGSDRAPAPRLAADSAAKWVEQLGAPEYADREAATNLLRALGLKADSALRSGLKSENPEVRNRCARLLGEIRADARAALVKGFDPAGTDDYDHPLWKRFKSLAGSDASARKLFAEIIADSRRLQLLDAAERDPDKAGELYELEVRRLAENTRKGVERPDWRTGGFAIDGVVFDPNDPTPKPADVAVGFFLGTFATSAKAFPDPRWEGHAPYGGFEEGWGLFHAPFQQGVEYPHPSIPANKSSTPAFRRLVAAWLARRENPGSICLGLNQARAQKVAEVLPTARSVATDARQPVKVRAAAIPILGGFGGAEDEPRIASLLDDKTAYTGTKYGPKQQEAIAQVRDMALATLLVLRGKDPGEFGFPGLEFHRTGRFREIPLYPYYLGFYDDSTRAAAHSKANVWLAEQPKKEGPKKEEPKPDPVVVKLVEQLGAAEFADREAAAKQLRALGTRAELALKAALKSEDPEIRQRTTKILSEIRDDLLQARVKGFDPAKEQQPDHPIWTRFKTLAGDSRAARDLFAGIIKNPNWLRRLDTAEANPAAALRQYQEAVIEVGKHFGFLMSVSFEVPVWPCDRGEEVAYLLLLGSYPNTASIPPGNDPTRGQFDAGEGRIHFARGLELGLQGKMLEDTLAFRPTPGKTAEGMDRVFAKLLAGWLEHREPAADVVPNSLWLAARYGAKEVLPFARIIAADKFPHDRTPPRQLCTAALALVARAGTREDLPLFEKYFKDESVIATFELEDEKTGSKGATQLRDAAFGLALVLHGEDPAKYGFVIAGRRWTQTYARTVVGKWDPCAFGFLNGDDNKARLAAHAKVKEFLDKQPKIEPKPVGQLHTFEGHTGLVGGVAFFPTGDRIVTSGFDATYRIWDAKTGKELEQRSTGPKESQVGGPVAISPDGKRIAARYFVAEADTGKFLFGLEGHTGRIARITYSTDGKRILTTSHDGTVRVWEADGKELQRIDAHMGQKVAITSGGLQPREERYVNRGAWDAVFSSDGKRIVSGGVDGIVRVWDTDNGKELQCMKLDRVTVMAVAFLPDDKRVVSSGSDGIIHIWDAATGKELGKCEGHTGIVSALAVTRDGKRVVSAGHDKTVRVWDVETGKELRCFRGHTAAVQAVAVSPDGKTALSGGEDNTARLWSLPGIER